MLFIPLLDDTVYLCPGGHKSNPPTLTCPHCPRNRSLGSVLITGSGVSRMCLRTYVRVCVWAFVYIGCREVHRPTGGKWRWQGLQWQESCSVFVRVCVRMLPCLIPGCCALVEAACLPADMRSLVLSNGAGWIIQTADGSDRWRPGQVARKDVSRTPGTSGRPGEGSTWTSPERLWVSGTSKRSSHVSNRTSSR